MNLPDPKQLFAYLSELHDAGFGDKTARAIVAAVAGKPAHEELTATLEVTAEPIQPYTFPEIVSATRRAVEKSAEEATKGTTDIRCEVACLFDTRYGGIGVRCEPSRGGGSAFLSMDKGVGQIADHLTRSETVLLRDTLTAILEAE